MEFAPVAIEVTKGQGMVPIWIVSHIHLGPAVQVQAGHGAAVRHVPQGTTRHSDAGNPLRGDQGTACKKGIPRCHIQLDGTPIERIDGSGNGLAPFSGDIHTGSLTTADDCISRSFLGSCRDFCRPGEAGFRPRLVVHAIPGGLPFHLDSGPVTQGNGALLSGSQDPGRNSSSLHRNSGPPACIHLRIVRDTESACTPGRSSAFHRNAKIISKGTLCVFDSLEPYHRFRITSLLGNHRQLGPVPQRGRRIANNSSGQLIGGTVLSQQGGKVIVRPCLQGRIGTVQGPDFQAVIG